MVRLSVGTAATLFLMIAASGCVDGSKSPPELSKVFGPQNVGRGNETVEDPLADLNGTYIYGARIEGRFETGNSSEWQPSATAWVRPAKITLTKADPGPAGGGGVEQPLQVGDTNLTLVVRLIDASRLSGYDVRWTAFHPGETNLSYSSPASAESEHRIEINEPGTYYVMAQLWRGEKLAATTAAAWKGHVNVGWTVESAVRPVKPMDPTCIAGCVAPNPPNYDQMADKFPFQVTSRLPILMAKTEFRGTYQPGMHGTDIGLELVMPNEEKICADMGATANGAPGPDEAKESLEHTEGVPVGEAMIRAGALDCMAGYYYHNPGLVPYTLTLELYYGGTAPK